MTRVARVAILVAAGMGMTYFLFAVCGPYWSQIVISDHAAVAPAAKQAASEFETYKSTEDDWADWVKAAPKGEVRKVTVSPDGTFILRSTVHNGFDVESVIMEPAPHGILIGEIESDLWGTDR